MTTKQAEEIQDHPAADQEQGEETNQPIARKTKDRTKSKNYLAFQNEAYTIRYTIAKAMLEQNKTYDEIQAKLGLSSSTIARISRGDIQTNEPIVNALKHIESNKISILCHRILDSITDNDIIKASLMQRITSFGILTDKKRLIDGQPTEIFDFNKVAESIEKEIQNIAKKRSELMNDVVDVEPIAHSTALVVNNQQSNA